MDTGEWVAGDAPLDEGYWDALMRDEEHGEGCGSTARDHAADVSADWPAPADHEASGQGHDAFSYGPPPPVGEIGEPHALPAVGEPEPARSPEAGGDPWEDARALMDRGAVLDLEVTGHNRGGVLVEWNGLQGFVPASHLVNLSPFADEEGRYDELRQLVGKSLRLKVIEIESGNDRFILSERAARHDEDRRQDLLLKLSPGDVCQGCVTNLCSFGAFVDLGGLEGLVHVSELSWGRVEHPGDVLEPGQLVDVYVLQVERDRGRVGLSVRRLHPDPWDQVEDRYHVGQVVEGVITHVVDFGAFACVEDGLEGLIHVSELAEDNVVHPRDVVQVGDTVRACVLSVDGDRRRMGLSLRQVDGEEAWQ